MADKKPDFTSVDDYIAAQPEASRAALQRVRNTIRKAIPGAAETISYQMPTYKIDGDPVLYFAGWKQHYSLYPASGRLLAAFQQDLAPYQVNKATIRFPLAKPVPVKLIERIAKFRAREVRERKEDQPAAAEKKKKKREPPTARQRSL